MATDSIIVSPTFNGDTVPLTVGLIVRLKPGANNNVVRALADSAPHVQGVNGVVISGSAAPTSAMFVSSAGRQSVQMEVGLTLAVGDTVYVSASVAGKGTNVKPTLVAAVGIVADVSNYARLGTIEVDINSPGSVAAASTPGVISFNGETGVVKGTLASIYGFGLSDDPVDDNVFHMPSGDLSWPGATSRSAGVQVAFFQPRSMATSDPPTFEFIQMASSFGDSDRIWRQMSLSDPAWNGTFAQLIGQSWTVDAIGFNTSDTTVGGTVLQSRNYLATGSMPQGYLTNSNGLGILQTLALYNADFGVLLPPETIDAYGTRGSRVVLRNHGVTAQFFTAADFSLLTTAADDGVGWLVNQGFRPVGGANAASMLAAQLTDGNIAGGYYWGVWGRSGSEGLGTITPFLQLRAGGGSTLNGGFSVGSLQVGGGDEVQEVAFTPGGASTLTLGATNAPNGLVATTPSKYLDVTIDGQDYILPLWQVAPPVAMPQTNLVLWVRADSGVVTGGKGVQAWNDKSGDNFDLTAAGTFFPQLQTNVINGLPALQMTTPGEEALMGRSQSIMAGSSDRDVFMVCKFRTSAGGGMVCMGTPTGGFNAVFNQLSSTAIVWQQESGSFASYIDGTDFTGTSVLFRWSHDGSGLSFAKNGVDVGPLTFNGSFAPGDGAPYFTLGGWAMSDAIDFPGWIAEVLVYNAKLSAPNALTVTTNLMTKYGL